MANLHLYLNKFFICHHIILGHLIIIVKINSYFMYNFHYYFKGHFFI